jgi:hypothetical protein
MLFKVEYQIKLAKNSHGEFTAHSMLVVDSMLSVSNYLPEIFTDIYDKHRGQHILGIEIIGVEESDADYNEALCTVDSCRF